MLSLCPTYVDQLIAPKSDIDFMVILTEEIRKEQSIREEKVNTIKAHCRSLQNIENPFDLNDALGWQKRMQSAEIGMHVIYTIKDTLMIRVCEPPTRISCPLEQRYLRIFNDIDLNSNSYSESDLNQINCWRIGTTAWLSLEGFFFRFQRKNGRKDRVQYAFRNVPRQSFVWNSFQQTPEHCARFRLTFEC